MNDLRTAAQQALEALEQIAVLAEYGTTGPGKCHSRALNERQATSLRLSVSDLSRAQITVLRAALAQEQAEQTWVCPEAPEERTYSKPGHCENCGKTLVLAQEQAVPVQEHEDWCASVTQLLLSYPPQKAPCNCKKKQAEPVQKPVAWINGNELNDLPHYKRGTVISEKSSWRATPLYAAPPKAEPKPMHPELRKMWEDYFDKCFRAMPVPQRKPLTEEEIDDLSREMVKSGKSVNWLCRAIERAHGIV